MAAANLGIFPRAFSRGLKLNQLKSCGQISSQSCRRLMSTSAGKSTQNTAKLLLASGGIGCGLGIGWAVYDSLKGKKAHITFEETPAFFLDKLPNVQITRKIVNPNDKTDLDLVLFQYQTCPFCCKVRAFLDSKGFSYSVVEVDAVLRQGLKWSTSKKVPTLLAKTKDGKYVQLTDSSVIISILATVLGDSNADIGELVKYYPKVSFVDDNGEKKQDVLNKYFVMQEGDIPKDKKDLMA